MIVFTQPNVITQMAKSRIQRNHARGFRNKARLGVELALNVLPEDMVVYCFVCLALLGEISLRVARSLRRLISTRVRTAICGAVELVGRSLTFLLRKPLSVNGSALFSMRRLASVSQTHSLLS